MTPTVTENSDMATGPVFPTSQPLYETVKAKIKAAIHAGIWRPGEVIPSETDLADRFAVSQGTIRRAVRELATDGILVKRQGRGTFVMSPSVNYDVFRNKLLWFTPDDPACGDRIAVIAAFERIETPPRVAEMLEMQRGGEVFHVKRHHRWAKYREVFCFEDIYLPVKYFAGLSEEELSRAGAAQVSLYPLFETRFGITVASMIDRARAVMLNPQQAVYAGVPSPYPGISIERQTYTIGHEIVEFRSHVCVTDRMCIVKPIGNL